MEKALTASVFSYFERRNEEEMYWYWVKKKRRVNSIEETKIERWRQTTNDTQQAQISKRKAKKYPREERKHRSKKQIQWIFDDGIKKLKSK